MASSTLIRELIAWSIFAGLVVLGFLLSTAYAQRRRRPKNALRVAALLGFVVLPALSLLYGCFPAA